MNDTADTVNLAGKAVRAELGRIMTDKSHPDHAGYWRQEETVMAKMRDMYTKAYPTGPAQSRSHGASVEVAPNLDGKHPGITGIDEPLPEASAERGKEAGTEDLIEEDPTIVEATFRREWGQDYEERWAGVANIGQMIASQNPQLFQELSTRLGDSLGIRALDFIRQNLIGLRF